MTGDGRGLQVIVLSAVAILMLMLCVLVAVGIERNRSALLEAAGIPTVPPADPAQANARLHVGDLQRVLGSPANYPADAAERGQGGLVVATLAIAPTGVITDCSITKSSGTASLDNATCQLARTQIRAQPARDGAGRAISSNFVLRMRWVPPD